MTEVEKQLKEIRDSADKVLAGLHKVSDYPMVRPKFVEFAGTPKSGKSTCIDNVGHFFHRVGFNVLAPTEGASKRTPHYLKQDRVAFNVWSACYALSHILEGLHGTDRYHLVLLDRGLFDALAWIEMQKHEKNGISESECKAIQEFLLVKRWREVIDVVFLFYSDPDTCMKRENAHKIIEEPGSAMNPAYLAKLNDAYATIERDHAAVFKKVEKIDTGSRCQSTPQSTAIEVTRKIIDVF